MWPVLDGGPGRSPGAAGCAPPSPFPWAPGPSAAAVHTSLCSSTPGPKIHHGGHVVLRCLGILIINLVNKPWHPTYPRWGTPTASQQDWTSDVPLSCMGPRAGRHVLLPTGLLPGL